MKTRTFNVKLQFVRGLSYGSTLIEGVFGNTVLRGMVNVRQKQQEYRENVIFRSFTVCTLRVLVCLWGRLCS
jgi:hypothetical protein